MGLILGAFFGLCICTFGASWALQDPKAIQTESPVNGHAVYDGESIRPRMEFKKYRKHEVQTWDLAAGAGVWGLVFRQMSIEPSHNCQYDFLEVVEITNSTDPPITASRYCGERIPHPYISRHPRLRLRFVTDNLWELDGFWIQAVHANNKELLTEKIAKLPKTNVQRRLALSSKETGSGNDEYTSEGGSLYYILLGASAAALLVFCAQIAYLIIAIRNKSPNRSIMVPNIYYNSQPIGESMDRSNGQGTNRNNVVMDKNKGKRYSKDRSGNNPIDDNTFKKTFVVNGKSHHNNVYTFK